MTATHVPVVHADSSVHASPLLQGVPSTAAGLEQVPVAGEHAPGKWQASLATHVTGLLPTHAPLWQASTCVHALPSVHAVPFGAAGLEQTPVPMLHTPATWHASDAEQTTGVPLVHAPA